MPNTTDLNIDVRFRQSQSSLLSLFNRDIIVARRSQFGSIVERLLCRFPLQLRPALTESLFRRTRVVDSRVAEGVDLSANRRVHDS